MMSATEGNNDELNGELAAQKRLHLAWEMHGALSFAAHKQVMIANVLQLLILGFGICTLGITLLRINIEDDQGSEGDGDGDVDWDCETSVSSGCQLTKYLQVIFPALVTTLLTVQSYLDPDGQAIVLTSGAARIETEIYMFRTGTGPYGRSGFASGSASSGGGSSGLVSSREHFGQKITAIWDGILMLPVVGIVDSRRAQDIMQRMLEQISEKRATVFILDISGVAVVDTAVANHLIRMTKAARLMGSYTIVSGLSPSVAQTIVELGIEVGEMRTTGNLQDALKIAFDHIGGEHPVARK
jgi:anti-anti-sigma regulatory factor